MWVCAEDKGTAKITANGRTVLGVPTEKAKDSNADPIIGDILALVSSK